MGRYPAILAAYFFCLKDIHSGEMLCQFGYYEGLSSNQSDAHVGWLLPSLISVRDPVVSGDYNS